MDRGKTKDWLKENWFKVGLLVILVVFVAGAFYWWGWRPRQIRAGCTDVILEKGTSDEYWDLRCEKLDDDECFRRCLTEKGL